MSRFRIPFLCTTVFLIISSSLHAAEKLPDYIEMGRKDVREPAVAGRFYNGTKSGLKKQVNSMLSNEHTEDLPGKPIAIISPHAGYQYSGSVAASGFNAIKKYNYKRVIIIAPTHKYGGHIGGASILNVEYYRTPLGLIKVDTGICNNLINNPPYFGTFEKAHTTEHSLETQLPFLQMVLGDFKLVPILIGRLTDEIADFLADKIRPFIDEDTLVIASSDFTHYGPNYDYRPRFKGKSIEASIKQLDYGLFERILALDFNGLKEYKKATGINACGFAPVALLLKLLPKGTYGKVLHYDTSGSLTGDFTNSVSYASIIFTRSQKSSKVIDDSELNHDEQLTLIKIARETLESYVKKRDMPDINSEKYKFTKKLQEKRGVFVTLNKNGNLRGCIGNILPKGPLYNAVIDNTINSSTKDTRFKPVSKNELPDIEIDISVLSPIKEISGPENFIPGRHGIIIRWGRLSAVFLPQVATEQGWDREETLGHLCKKAGLPEYTWKDEDMKFFIFTAQVFHENRI